MSFSLKWSEVAQSCPTLCDPMDCSLQGSSIHGIFKARVPEWGAISFSRWSSQPRGQTLVSQIAGKCFTVWATKEAVIWLSTVLIVALQAPLSMEFSRQEYWSGFPFPSPLESSRPRDRTLVSHIAGRCFNLWATREALVKVKSDAIKNNIA